MAVPLLFQQPAFDAENSHEFTYSFSGSQVFATKIVVKNNATNTIVYQNKNTSFQLKITVPALSLTNGVLYSAYVTVFDINDVESSPSNTIIFYCYTSPSWSFTNLVDNQIIRNASYGLELSYSQSEGELLNSWQVFLYDSTQRQISTSGVRYKTDVLSYTIANLEDNNAYFVRATGTTVNGMLTDTGYIPISVEYINPSMFAIVSLENQELQGNIKIQSNIISIIGTSNPDPPTYVDNDTMVDLTESGVWVKFEEGFSIKDDFTLQMRGKTFTKNITTPFCRMTNNIYNIDLFARNGTFDGASNQFYIELKAYNALTNYVIISNLINRPLDTDMIEIWVRRVGSVYELKIENVGV